MRLKDDIRLLLGNRDRSTMEYITDLKKHSLVKCFFKGYTATSSKENDTNSLSLMKWNSKKESREAGFIWMILGFRDKGSYLMFIYKRISTWEKCILMQSVNTILVKISSKYSFEHRKNSKYENIKHDFEDNSSSSAIESDCHWSCNQVPCWF